MTGSDGKEIDIDVQRRKRIEDWLKRRWNNGEDMGNIPQLLLDYEHQLMEWEVERQSA